MQKWCLTALAFLFTAACAGGALGQELRIYNDGVIDYVPMQASIMLDAEDLESTLQEIQVSIDGGSLQPYDGALSFNSEGRHIVVYRAVDRTGNISTEKIYSVIVDGTPPDGAAGVDGALYLSGDNELYITADAQIVLWAEDELSGVDRIFVSLDGGGFVAYAEPVAIREEGYHTATAYAVDNVGNRTVEFEVAGYVDSTPPEVSIQPEEDFVVVQGTNYTHRQNQFRVTASDQYAGVREVLVSLDGSDYVTYTGSFKVQLAGRHTLRAVAADNLGNRSEPAAVEFYVDVVPPDTSMGVSVD
jgi:hypothetical protein